MAYILPDICAAQHRCPQAAPGAPRSDLALEQLATAPAPDGASRFLIRGCTDGCIAGNRGGHQRCNHRCIHRCADVLGVG